MTKPSVLVVEDEAIVATHIQTTLEDLGYSVPAIALSGQEGIEKAEELLPDLALMDIVLPGGMDGIEAAAEIRSRFGIPVVYLTAYSDEQTLQRAKRTGPCGYVLKPFKERELRVNIEMALFKHDKDDEPRRREQRYRQLAKSLPQTVFEMDETGTLTFASRQASEVFGYTEDDFAKGLSAIQMIAASDRDRAKQDIARCLQEQRPVTAEYTALRKNRSKFPVLACVSPILREKERTGLRGIAIDITEYKRTEAERGHLEQKAQLASRLATVGQLASGMGHEINNPLTTVIGFSQLLMQEDLPEDIKEQLAIINEGGQRIADIVKRLTVFARRQKLQPDYLNINDTIRTTLNLMAHRLETSSIKVTFQLDPGLPSTIADTGQLQQVFLNLIINAETEMRLAHGKGKLSIKTEKADNTIRVSFKDDGPGIAEDNLEKIFDPFFTTREVGEGTGLGLSICHGIITEHNGRIYAQSEPGQGATFIVELPVVAQKRRPSSAKPAAKKFQKVAPANILVVDDEPAILSFLSQLLTSQGHRVDTVDNATDALEKIKSHSYSLALLDIKIPGMAGTELYDRIKRIDQSLAKRVVFISGDVLGVDTMAFLSKTKAPWIAKPFDIEQLKKVVNSILSAGT